MSNIRKLIGQVLLAVLILLGIIVGISIWNSLKATEKELADQKRKASVLAHRDSSLRIYKDSVDQIIANLKQEERRLQQERYELQRRLLQLQETYIKRMAQIDTLWQAGSVLAELDKAFPHWKGQFWEANRRDGVHGLIAPRFFGAEVVEIKTELNKRQHEMVLKDSTIENLEVSLALKDSMFQLSELKADSLWKTYKNVYSEYDSLNQKYQSLLLKKWFMLKLTPGSILSAGLGFGTGYAVGKAGK